MTYAPARGGLLGPTQVPVRGVAVTCARCGKEFSVYPSRVGRKNYCSRTCSYGIGFEAERFDERCERDEDTGCLIWTGTKDVRGYGVFCVQGEGRSERRIKAHRWAWQRANGEPVPRGLMVLHSCDNPSCVEPAHLRVGTGADNVADRVRRRRGTSKNKEGT